MEMYKRQQFEFLLQTAVERFAERLEQRCHSREAIEQAAAGDLEPFGLNDFVDAIFVDFLLDNVDGACFILQAVPNKPVGPQVLLETTTVQNVLIGMAKHQFRELLRRKTQEAIDLRSSFQPVQAAMDEPA